MSNAEQLLAKIREQTRLRQKAFYLRNKEKVNEKRRDVYKAGRQALKGVLPEKPLEQIPVVEETFEIELPPKTFEIELPPKKKRTNKKVSTNVPVITYDDAITKLTQLRSENIIKTDGTFKKYKDDLKRFVTITGCDDISQCLQKHSLIIKEINNGKMKNGQPYSNNTIKSVYQSILFIIDTLNIKVDKKPYEQEYNIRILKSNDDNAEKKENEEVFPFKTYMEKVKDKFGDDSKMYLIASMYDELTVRDNFQLKLVSNVKDIPNDIGVGQGVPAINYLLVPKSGNIKIVINSYKTEAKYGIINHTFKKNVSTMIRKYITNNSIKIDDYLFGDKPLTQFVSSNNPKIGIQGGINLFRQMKIADEIKLAKTPEERLALADKMRHSPVSQLWYLRKQKLI